MFALVFRFPAGRYHATPWGRHVNEGAVAWPPEPFRLLRALISVWHRKADQTRWSEAALQRLIETLAEACPVYRLPDAVHAHTRHYMPQGKLDGDREKTSLVFDAFFCVAPEDELVIAWPDLSLQPEQYALAEHLAELMGYLGRAESIVVARATDEIGGEFSIKPGEPTEPGWTGVDVLVPLSPVEYAACRPTLLSRNADKPKSKGRSVFEATLPEALADALQVETSQIQAVGWSRPPAAKLVSYGCPTVGPRPPSFVPPPAPPDDSDRFQVARFVLAGRPRPPITEAVKIGEVFRRALMSRVHGAVPAVLSGRDETGDPLRDPQHRHAFFLPEDHDGDGLIDHLVLYARLGLPREVRSAAEELRRLWIGDRGRTDTYDEGEAGRREWRLALEGFGGPAQFNDSSLLTRSKVWTSLTPYMRPRHLKRGDPWEATQAMVQAECERRGWPTPEVDVGPDAGRTVRVGGSPRNVLAFHRFRSRRGLVQPDRTGLSLRLLFPEAVSGPVSLGFGCHYGLGLFRSGQE